MSGHHILFKLSMLFLLIIITVPAFAETGKIDDKLIDRFISDFNNHGDQSSLINALTNNNIKSLSLNREKLLSHDTFMNLKLEGSKITNQKGSGRCWMFAGGNIYSPKVITKLSIDNFELSESYLAFWDKMEKSNLFLENIIEHRDKEFNDRTMQTIIDSPFGDGGWWHYFTDLVNKYGIVPISAMPETKQSSSTGNINKLATSLLRKGASNIRQMHRWGNKESELRQIKEETLSEIYRLLTYSYGKPPVEFTLRYNTDDSAKTTVKKTYTPISFSSEIFGDQLPDYVALINNPVRDFDQLYLLEGSRNIYEKSDFSVLNLTSEKLREYTLASLIDSQAVWFACDVGKDNYNDSGLFKVDIYDFNSTFNMDFKLSKTDRINFQEISPNHAMVISGTDTTDTGEPVKWMVENSWGSKKGKDGYWYMYNDWFDEYVLMVIIDKKLLSDEDAKKFEQKPITVPTWEPFFLALRNLGSSLNKY